MTIGKLFALALCLCMPVIAVAQGRTVKDEMLHMQQTRKVSFVYDSALKTNMPYKGASLDKLGLKQALKVLFHGTGISYKVKGRYILLKGEASSAMPNKVNRPNKPNKPTKPASHTLSGYVRDSHGETLVNATVYDFTTHQGTMTNAYGFFSLTLPEGEHRLRVSYLGFEDRDETVNLSNNQRQDISLAANARIDEVVVTANLNSPLINTQTGKRSLTRDDIKTEFALLSSPDVVKTLQRISGVAEGVELASGLYVHGGNNDENLYLIDGTPLYSINHTLGLFSAFNADIVKNVDFYKSGFPARYGGRLSSVVDVRTADGDFQRWHGSYRLGLLDGSVQVEGPIRKGKTSFNFGLRRSWLDLVTRPLFWIRNSNNDPDDDDINLSYFFHDLNAKVTNVFSDRSRMSLSVYSGQDGLHTKDVYKYGSMGDDADRDETNNRFNWGNFNVALDWQYQFSPKLFANFTAIYTHNRSRLRTYENEVSNYGDNYKSINYTSHEYRSTIYDAGYRAAFDFRPSPHHHIRFGTDYTWHTFHPQTKDDRSYYGENEKVDSTVIASHNNLIAHEWNAYAEDEITVNSHWSLNAGANASLFHVQGKTFSNADPRLAVKYQVSPTLSFKASWTMMTQYVHKISNSVLDLPTDYWVPTTKRLKPMRSQQFAVGTYLQPNKHWLLSLEGYYKCSRHLLQYASWTGLEPPAGSWDNVVMDGKGRFYGLEFDGTYKARNLLLQGSYTLSWNKRKYDDFYPEWYYDKFDNRHKINLSARWNISKKVSMFAVWTYHTGNHLTVPTQYTKMPVALPENEPYRETVRGLQRRDGIGSEWMENNWDMQEGFIYEKPSNLSLPAYHRLDMGFDFRHTTKHGHERVWNLSLYNVYCHLNSLWVDFKFNHQGKFIIKNRAYIPIIPSFSYIIKW